MTILVTGGLGFIGSNFIRKWSSITNEPLVCIDNNQLNNLENHDCLFKNKNKLFVTSIGNKKHVKNILLKYEPRLVINFAAESNVDKSIKNPFKCYQNNCTETLLFLEEVTNYYLNNPQINDEFQFVQISTDEVYGSLEKEDRQSIETDLLNPKNPYSASKVATEHMLRAFQNTYGLPYKITRCTNNFGPYQSEDKLIPKTIISLLNDKNVPIYGRGDQIRDWLYVEDHIDAILKLIEIPQHQLVLNIGANNERSNLDIVKKIAILLDKTRPIKGKSYTENIEFVEDRLGHDRRYAINASKLKSLVNWCPSYDFDKYLKETINFYLVNS
ncbi:GDP-mannose 4,6-dehydratase [Alphaproteobacteria bacterium]|nr:GDP-mannose 4,6-dehydratase [Alphaproteobacteria bacterium]